MDRQQAALGNNGLWFLQVYDVFKKSEMCLMALSEWANLYDNRPYAQSYEWLSTFFYLFVVLCECLHVFVAWVHQLVSGDDGTEEMRRIGARPADWLHAECAFAMRWLKEVL